MGEIVSVQVEGLDDLLSSLSGYGDRLVPTLGTALYAEAEVIMTDSKTTYVPVLSGALRSTGHVEQPAISAEEVSVTLGFGDDAVDYALVVHENLNAHHPVGQAKYLEVPIMNALPGMAGRLGDRMRGAA